MNPKETALARKKGIQFALFLPLAGLEVPSGPDGRLKGSGAASLMVSPVWGGRGWSRSGDNPSHHFCVCQLKLQRQPKGGLIRFVLASVGKQQVEAAFWFYFFHRRAL